MTSTTNRYSRYYKYIKPVIENKLVRSYTPYIFSLTTITILVVFAIRPTITTILALQKTHNENQKTIEALDKKIEDLTIAQKNLQNIDPNIIVKINTLVPAQPSVTTLIASLQNASVKYASISALQIQPVIVIDNRTAPDKARLATDEVEFSYNIQGSFVQLSTILQNLTQSPRLITIKSLTLTKQSETPTTSLSINGKAYFLK